MGNADQPRAPKGSPNGGQWIGKGDTVSVAGRTGTFKVGAIGERVVLKTHFGSDAGMADKANVTLVKKAVVKSPAVKGTGETLFAALPKGQQAAATTGPLFGSRVPTASSSLTSALNKTPTVKGGFTPFKKYDPREDARSKG